MRKQVTFKSVPYLGVFYKAKKGRVRYRRLPDHNVMEWDMGNRYPALIYAWVREDWKGKVQTTHSWSGDPEDVWVD